MSDRAFGILGIALTLVMAVIQYSFPSIPNWVPAIVFGIGVLLVGVAVGMTVRARNKKAKPVPVANLRLHMFGDHRTPSHIASENIFRWYYLYYQVGGLDRKKGVVKIGAAVTLYVSFENDVQISTLVVSSPDMHLPLYEVKEFNQRFAIIFFSETVPAGTLEIHLSP